MKTISFSFQTNWIYVGLKSVRYDIRLWLVYIWTAAHQCSRLQQTYRDDNFLLSLAIFYYLIYIERDLTFSIIYYGDQNQFYALSSEWFGS